MNWAQPQGVSRSTGTRIQLSDPSLPACLPACVMGARLEDGGRRPPQVWLLAGMRMSGAGGGGFGEEVGSSEEGGVERSRGGGSGREWGSVGGRFWGEGAVGRRWECWEGAGSGQWEGVGDVGGAGVLGRGQ